MVAINFRYLTGLKGSLFANARLRGSWDGSGTYAADWSEQTMTPFVAEDGCPGFQRTVELDPREVGKRFRWGVVVGGPSSPNFWAIPTEVAVPSDSNRYREFVLGPSPASEDYHLTFARRLGARKYYAAPGRADLRFAVWAPNARAVEVVFAVKAVGYIADDGAGIDPLRPAIPLTLGVGGIWTSPVLPDFDAFRGLPYMYRITTEQGELRYRTDIFSRAQLGSGEKDPARTAWDGDPATLDGAKGCSLVVGQDTVAESLADGAPRIPRSQFWQDEFSIEHVVPSRVEDLVIYELHVGGLGFGLDRPGNLRDAIAFLEHLVLLGINAVELLPVAEFSGEWGWGYGDTHQFVIASSAGSLDDAKHFVRECHRRGIAVILDVCYNHYDSDAERAQWQYDSTLPEHNGYYWYEGKSSDYHFDTAGYLNNGSSGYTPRFSEEVVRQQFIASAALLIEECHIDGFRVDLTQAIHRDNSLNANGWIIGSANLFGQKFLREWSRTLTMIKPTVLLIAEDHTGWEPVTESPDVGGLGFGARWFAGFYHDLVGDSDAAAGHARVLRTAGFGGDGPLALDALARALHETQRNCVVYHESHDEAGNSGGSVRTMVAAVGGATLTGSTRDYAEARSRVVFTLSLFSAGTPLFFMGEEVGATLPYRYDDFGSHREDIVLARAGRGASLFRYYQDAIALRRHHPAARSHTIDILHVNNEGRVLAFLRRSGTDQLLVIASLSNHPYHAGYVINSTPERLESGTWLELLNSDAAQYGGANCGNFGTAIRTQHGRFEALLPANGVLIFGKSATSSVP